MSGLRLFYGTVIRSRCPCCGRGPVFDGFRVRERCSDCDLCFDQWRGEWITPTYLAGTVGMLVAFGLVAWMIWTGRGMDGPVPPELVIAGVSSLAALATLRPAKAAWLAFLYRVGAVEVSARTRARLRWRR